MYSVICRLALLGRASPAAVSAGLFRLGTVIRPVCLTGCCTSSPVGEKSDNLLLVLKVGIYAQIPADGLAEYQQQSGKQPERQEKSEEHLHGISPLQV